MCGLGSGGSLQRFKLGFQLRNFQLGPDEQRGRVSGLVPSGLHLNLQQRDTQVFVSIFTLCVGLCFERGFGLRLDLQQQAQKIALDWIFLQCRNVEKEEAWSATSICNISMHRELTISTGC